MANRSFNLRNILPVLLLILLAGLAALAFQPEGNRISRFSAVLLAAILMGIVLRFTWKRPWIRNGFIALLCLCGGLMLFPWQIRTSAADLRNAYVERLRSYEGCEYFWGGESRLGIDCSGLIRKGLIDACFREGIRSADLGAVRQGLSLWWNDTSAKALGEEYDGLTQTIQHGVLSLNELDHTGLKSGDLAVTANGIHIMAYLGEKTWIEADPGLSKVVIEHIPAETNSWFKQPMKIVRWSLLSGQ